MPAQSAVPPSASPLACVPSQWWKRYSHFADGRYSSIRLYRVRLADVSTGAGWKSGEKSLLSSPLTMANEVASELSSFLTRARPRKLALL